MKNNTTDTKKPSRQEKVQALSEDWKNPSTNL